MPDPNNTIIFPSGMDEKALIADNDKLMWSDSEDGNKPKWKAYTELLANLGITIPYLDASNLSSGNIDSWNSALKVAFRKDQLLSAFSLNVEDLTENGYYKTDISTTGIPSTNRVGVVLVLNYDTDKKFLTYHTIESDIPVTYWKSYNGSSWSAWVVITNPDLSPYNKVDGSTLTTDSGGKDTWKTWLATFLSNIELTDILLTSLETAYTPTEKQTWWGLTTKSILVYLTTLVDKVYSNYESINTINDSVSLYDDGMHWRVADLAARNAIPLAKRTVNVLVTYKTTGDKPVTQRYNYTDVDEVNWTNDSNWENLVSVGNTTDIREVYDSTSFDFTTLTFSNDGQLSDQTPAVYCMFGFDTNNIYINNGFGKFNRVNITKTITPPGGGLPV